MSGAPFSVVVAVDRELGIGAKNAIPWRIPADIRHFKRLTQDTDAPEKRNAVIMGRRTWESIPARFRPLPGRLNLVLTRSDSFVPPEGTLRARDFESALATLDQRTDIEHIFVVGGARVYDEALRHARCRDVYITRIEGTFDCDTHFPGLGPGYQLHAELERGTERGIDYRIEHWRARTSPDSAHGERTDLFDLFDVMDERRTERCILWSDPDSSLRAILIIDDTTLGPAVGGTRTRAYPSLGAAMDDAARLARAMTLKCALGGLDAGGAKIVVMEHPGMQRQPAFERLGRLIDELDGKVFTAGDLGTTDQDIAAVARHTRFVHTGGADLAASVATGLAACMRAALRVSRPPRGPNADAGAKADANADADLTGLRVALQGCGTIGAAVAHHLAGLGVELSLADIDHSRATRLARELDARTIPADHILSADVDILCPCAVGHVITTEVARQVCASIVCGAANNILASEEAGDVLVERGVLFVPDIIASAGAVVDGVGESVMGLADRQPLIQALGDTAQRILETSRDTGEPPHRVAEAYAWQRINAARAARS